MLPSGSRAIARFTVTIHVTLCRPLQDPRDDQLAGRVQSPFDPPAPPGGELAHVPDPRLPFGLVAQSAALPGPLSAALRGHSVEARPPHAPPVRRTPGHARLLEAVQVLADRPPVQPGDRGQIVLTDWAGGQQVVEPSADPSQGPVCEGVMGPGAVPAPHLSPTIGRVG